jgi:hypothetical protein
MEGCYGARTYRGGRLAKETDYAALDDQPVFT